VRALREALKWLRTALVGVAWIFAGIFASIIVPIGPGEGQRVLNEAITLYGELGQPSSAPTEISNKSDKQPIKKTDADSPPGSPAIQSNEEVRLPPRRPNIQNIVRPRLLAQRPALNNTRVFSHDEMSPSAYSSAPPFPSCLPPFLFGITPEELRACGRLPPLHPAAPTTSLNAIY
jgi:hypothetical protein